MLDWGGHPWRLGRGSTLGGPSPGLVALAGDGVRPWRLWQGLWYSRYSGACPGEMAPLEVGAQGCCVVRLGAGGVSFGDAVLG